MTNAADAMQSAMLNLIVHNEGIKFVLHNEGIKGCLPYAHAWEHRGSSRNLAWPQLLCRHNVYRDTKGRPTRPYAQPIPAEPQIMQGYKPKCLNCKFCWASP